MALVMTKAALALKNANKDFKVVKYESHKRKLRKTEPASDETETKKSRLNKPLGFNKTNEVDLKKIRHEVVKFGMSGFEGAKKEEAKIALAVSLGAKPPPRKYINYKELIKQRKEEKLRLREKKLLDMAKCNLLQGTGKKKKKTLNDVGHLLSNYGKVQKKDLKNKEGLSNTKKGRRK